MDFLNDIPIWVYAVVGGVGLVLGAVLIFLHVRAVPPPGATSKGATPQLIFGIISLVLLGLVPLVLMIIALTQEDGRDRKRDRNRDRDRDRVEEDRSDARGERAERPGDMPWRVEFETDGVIYQGQFEPRGGAGPMKIVYTHDGQEKRIRQDCTLTGERQVRITCRNVRVLAGDSGYSADNFDVRWDGEYQMTGTVSSLGTGTATFRRGSHPRFADASWNAPGRDPQTTPAPPPTAGGGDLAARLSAAVLEQRSRLPLRNGQTTIVAIDSVGTTLNLWVQIATDLNATQWSQIEQAMRAQTCAGPYGRLAAAGASVSYHLVDSGQEQRSVTVSSC